MPWFPSDGNCLTNVFVNLHCSCSGPAHSRLNAAGNASSFPCAPIPHSYSLLAYSIYFLLHPENQPAFLLPHAMPTKQPAPAPAPAQPQPLLQAQLQQSRDESLNTLLAMVNQTVHTHIHPPCKYPYIYMYEALKANLAINPRPPARRNRPFLPRLGLHDALAYAAQARRPPRPRTVPEGVGRFVGADCTFHIVFAYTPSFPPHTHTLFSFFSWLDCGLC